MATYKVLQDIEAEDKLVGPFSLRQFIYAAIAAFFLYLSFFAVTKNVAFLLIFFIPPAVFTGFLAIPWHGDQPTEVWAIAKLRFYLKPRKRIWDQSGAKELVTITVPKTVVRNLTNGLDQDEVHSRLRVLASTIDSRGWAIKNANINAAVGSPEYQASDRLVDAAMLPQEVTSVDVRAADDILDSTANPTAQHFDTMITNAAAAQRQHLIEQMQHIAPPPAELQTSPAQPAPAAQPSATPPPAASDFWFMQSQPTAPAGQTTFTGSSVVTPGQASSQTLVPAAQADEPTAEEQAMVERLKAANATQTIADSHLKHIKT
ncbi:MAG: PrgI family protein, partial [Candidatus Saccharimonadales bacterium]